ncbi:hypothetical protein HN371_02655 [Candidatus Poribacteria bacterium]|jgi:hypothetical protein|nr:hypothetical protein [Candidatus Poribacteria bacterium]MBT5534176.1 hypothetical protein [Candidatus Poribacteria bacterium]MBT5710195.1 hypothetical protein [Candidatus Poribacteria bacterium]MBT7096262.1 hypothetical protein [Candidatus Poribacteria bacterium]MBT7804449.1 hypothetical protein [Candidatus Poribacteria bacterium]
MGDDELDEAVQATMATAAFSTYFNAIGYDHDTFIAELDGAVAHIKSQSG